MTWRCYAILLMAILSSGCTQNITGTAEQICETWEPIKPSRKDVLTPGTKEQIAGNNAANAEWCAQGAPQKVAANG